MNSINKIQNMLIGKCVRNDYIWYDKISKLQIIIKREGIIYLK